ncbi:hypothetical protein ACJZ2D_003138 [Fusarium nematophilum]
MTSREEQWRTIQHCRASDIQGNGGSGDPESKKKMADWIDGKARMVAGRRMIVHERDGPGGSFMAASTRFPEPWSWPWPLAVDFRLAWANGSWVDRVDVGSPCIKMGGPDGNGAMREEITDTRAEMERR